MVMSVTNFFPKSVGANGLINARLSGDNPAFSVAWSSEMPSTAPPAPNTLTPSVSLLAGNSALHVNIQQLGFVNCDPGLPNGPSGMDASDRVIFSCELREVTGSTTSTLISTQTRTFNYPQGGDLVTTFRWEFNGLQPGKQYMVGLRAWSRTNRTPYQDTELCRQGTYWSSFWAQRDPQAPTITSPPTNTTLAYSPSSSTEGVFTMIWSQDDPDMDTTQLTNPERATRDYSGWEVQYRPAPTPADPNPAWIAGGRRVRGEDGASSAQYILRQNTIRGGGSTTATQTAIPGPGAWQLRVRYKDDRYQNRVSPATYGGVWSPWSLPITVIYTAPYLAPLTLSPTNNQAQPVGEDVTFSWQFRDPRATGGSQSHREVQIREAGTQAWTQVIPTASQASATQSYTWAGASTFLVAGKRYEWQARTRSTPGAHLSTWSDSSFFWAVPEPDSGGVIPVPDHTVPSEGLGSGNNRAFIFDRGGVTLRDELRNPSKVVWHRKRDDMASATVRIDSWDETYAAFLGTIRCWQHEIVIFRETGEDEVERVWEGPITRITYGPGYVEFEAHDVMAYPYRRILRQGYNDAYIHKKQSGLTPVTVRAASVIQNALAYDDPNVLAYMRAIVTPDDARQSRVIPDYASTAYEDVDDMAASAGLDYCVAGRSIILWDTHNELGRLPAMGDGDFDATPIVTEYGMRMANVYAITNNNGVYGIADRLPTPTGDPVFGHIEMIDSAYGETDDAGLEETLTSEARAKLVETLTGQADRAIAPRYPTPLVARVPDNSRVMPHVPIGINQLIPGVYIPLQVTGSVRDFSQMQKLDMVTVDQRGDVEAVRITLSPAPGFGGLGDTPEEEGDI